MKLDYLSVNARHWLLKQKPAKFAANFSLINGLFMRWPISVELSSNQEILLLRDEDQTLHICHPSRAPRYSYGIRPFLDELQHTYLLDHVPLKPRDWVLDCGANIGEVSLALLQREPTLNIIAVEPETTEANCADLNLFDGRPVTVRNALWNEEKVLTFYSAAATADSSAIEPPTFNAIKQIPAITIDALLEQKKCSRLKLLKLEAEGAEPEILQGAVGSLGKIDYIAADLGPERGINQEETATPVINFLLSRGFQLIGMRFDRVIALFRNVNAID